jgi:DNA-binding transcriptional MerR regulator
MLRAMDSPDAATLMPIGRFARLTGLSVKALRHYDELGLLRPAAVDPETGYRSYSTAQVERAETIRLLRRLELPLDEISSLLAGRDPEEFDLPAAYEALARAHLAGSRSARVRTARAASGGRARAQPPVGRARRARASTPRVTSPRRGGIAHWDSRRRRRSRTRPTGGSWRRTSPRSPSEAR